jgi:simple sugar transport system ATP-binding protein
MVGRDVTLRAGAAAIGSISEDEIEAAPVQEAAGLEPVLKVEDASAQAPDGAVLLDGLSLEVRPGEVLGVAGVEGNGQTPLADVLSSLICLERGKVIVGGETVPTGKAGAMVRAGVSVIPADRHRSGCVTGMTVAENMMLTTIEGYASRTGILRPDEIRARARELIAEFDIHCPSCDTPLAQLSGGNQQRVVLARALSGDPRVLVAHQPTRGLDVGAIEYIGSRLQAAAESGIGVLLLSTDLGEIAALADRIVVIYRGRIIGEMSRAEMDMERLGLLIGGSVSGEDAA